MNKYTLLIVVCFFTTGICYSQECLANEFLAKYKQEDPLLQQTIQNVIFSFSHNLEGTKVQRSVVANDEIIMIPVVFNIIHNGESEGIGRNLSLTKINDQIDVMNQIYSGQYGGVDTKIRFCLAKQNIIGEATTGVNRFFGQPNYNICSNTMITDDVAIKNNIISGFPNTIYLNIWTADLLYCGQANQLNGYSSFPFTLESGEEDLIDGVVLNYKRVGINTTSNPNDIDFSNGRTAAHEAGHWLGLFHVFEDDDNIPCNSTSCDTEEDMVCDTESVEYSGFDNIAPGDCLGYNCNGQIINVDNIMDYQIPNRTYCRKKFTVGQKQRMRDILSYYKPSIYSQGSLFNFASCTIPGSSGGNTGGGGCNEDPTLKVQRIFSPNLNTGATWRKSFGSRIEVNDKWLVTIQIDAELGFGAQDIPDYLHIYKRIGCLYTLHKSFIIPLQIYDEYNDFGLILNNDEIIISSYRTDSVYIYHYNQLTDIWTLTQQIENNSVSNVGTSTFIVGNFLFILEKNSTATNIFRVYYKNANGIYNFHQNISLAGFQLPFLGKYLQAVNLKRSVVNFNSSTYIGSYDPPEILISTDLSGAGFKLFELNSNNMWILLSSIQPIGMASSEKTNDIEVSKDYIYVLTSAQTGHSGSQYDILYLYSYKINSNNFYDPFTSGYTKQVLFNREDSLYTDIKLQVYNDQFLFIDNMKYYPLKLFYNQNFGMSNLQPSWQLKFESITCSNPGGDKDDFEVFGNLLFYGYKGGIRIYNMSDILTKIGYDQSFISNSDFYNKKICTVPDTYSTYGEKITIGESCPIIFNYVKKELIANTAIIVKPGTTMSEGSEVKLKIIDSYGLCNSIVASRISNNSSEIKDVDYGKEVNEFKNNENKIILYSNPNKGIFKISLNLDNKNLINYSIYNTIGKLVFSSNTRKSIIDINLPNLPTGLYIVKLQGENYNEEVKFIKE